MKTIRLDEVIQDSIRMIEDKASLRNITLSSDMFQPDVYVIADKKRLKQVIVNLLDNAVKYNKKGGLVSIIVTAVEEEQIKISIVDTGYGIDYESIDKLFKPFSRLGADKLGIEGTGIGLSLCKQLVELMNGHIGVNSRLGEGCCFWVTLPGVEYENSIDENKIQEDDQFQFKETKGDKILLVEDNLVNCEVAVDMLEEMGLEVDVANNGQQALNLCVTNQYKLILMDCEMDIMDGFTATRKLRERERELQQTSIPIIALTAHAISGAREKCIASGMDDFLSKPFSLSDLNVILKRWLEIEDADVSIQQQREVNSVTHPADLNDIEGDGTVLSYEVINKLHKKQNKDDSNLMTNIISIYLEQASGLLSKLAEAEKNDDVVSVGKVAHTLKSSSENVGAIALAELCRTVERACEKGEIEEELVREIFKKYTDTEKALKDVLNNVRSGSDFA